MLTRVINLKIGFLSVLKYETGFKTRRASITIKKSDFGKFPIVFSRSSKSTEIST